MLCVGSCKKGHLRTEKSSYVSARGRVVCRICSNESHNKRRKLIRDLGFSPNKLEKVCKNGHYRTVKNTKIRADGTKECRICSSLSEQKRRNKVKLDALSNSHEEVEVTCRRMEEMFEVFHRSDGNGVKGKDISPSTNHGINRNGTNPANTNPSQMEI